MANGLLCKLSRAFQAFEQAIDIIFGRGFPSGKGKNVFMLRLHMIV